MEVPTVDTPLTSLFSTSTIPGDMAENLKVEDKRFEFSFCRAHQASAWAIKAATSSSFFARTSIMWLRELQALIPPDQPVLFIMCAGNELFYCMLYLLCFGEGPEILSGYAGLYRLILWVCTPIAITKSFISLIHLASASCNMAALDAAERAKKM